MGKIHKSLLTVLCLVGLLQPSCTKDRETLDASVCATKTFRATTELASRTTLDDNLNVIWSEGDNIVVIGITDAQNGKETEFTLLRGAGTVDGVFGSAESVGGYDGYYAFYPYSCYIGKEGYGSSKYLIQLNPNAVFAERNFVNGANPMAAYGTEKDGFKFHNLCGIVELQIKGSGTVDYIQIVSGDRKPLAGVFLADPETCKLEATNTFSGKMENYQCIYANLETPIELSDTPRSIYAVLPPGRYDNLQVRTIDSDGNRLVRTATKPVEVTRSRIVPVSEFSHSPEAGVPLITICYDEERSNFYQSKIQFKANDLSDGFYYCSMWYSDYEKLVAEGKTDYEILVSQGSTYEGTEASMTKQTYNAPGSKSVVLGLAYKNDESGKGRIFDKSTLYKLVYTAKQIPFDDTLTPQIRDESVHEDFAMFITTKVTLEKSRALGFVVSDDDYPNYSVLEKQLSATIGMYTDTFCDSANFGGILAFNGLIPNTKYHLIYTVTDGICWGMFSDVYTRYSPVQEHVFTTPAHIPSAATVTLAESEVADYTASISAAASDGSTKIKYLYTDDTYEYSADEVAAYGIELPLDGGNSVEIRLENLMADTTYHIYAVAYDENDSYGALSSLTFKTQPLTPVEDPEYAKFIGTYILTVGKGSTPSPRIVTVSEDVKGRTFKIKGLINPSLIQQYGLDDTVSARFENNEIRIACQVIANSGTVPDKFGGDVVSMHLRNETYTWYNPSLPLCSAYNDGVLTMKATSDDSLVWTGFSFNVGNRGYLEYYYDMVLTKQ